MDKTLIARVRKGLDSRQPLFYLLCAEERRIERTLRSLSCAHYGDDRELLTWTAVHGFTTLGGRERGPADPLEALLWIQSSGPEAFYLLKDFPALLAGQPMLVRALRDLYATLSGRNRPVFLSYPSLQLPEELKSQVYLVDFGLPAELEILEYLQAEIVEQNLAGVVGDDWLFKCASAMKGLTLDEVGHLFTRLAGAKKFDLAGALPEIHEEKATALLKEGCLIFIPGTVPIDQVGGLDNLKDWVLSRKTLFSKEAFEAGVPMPSGILFMGVSGCGKSLAAKVIADAWDLPLVRLDMNLVMSGAFGSPEYAFDRALKVAEHIAPLVLWIDEMENSFGYDSASVAGRGNNTIFSSFLTWMQEKPASVFVVATANRIEKLPAEIIRKGRFDQLFFLDLPSDVERKSIFSIHIEAYGADPATFNLKLLSAATRDWSGSEIEQAVKAARIHAYESQRMFDENDITWATGRMVPLSRTMEEQIKQLRQWSINRATPASKKAGV